jgi:hypothetical protein
MGCSLSFRSLTVTAHIAPIPCIDDKEPWP